MSYYTQIKAKTLILDKKLAGWTKLNKITFLHTRPEFFIETQFNSYCRHHRHRAL